MKKKQTYRNNNNNNQSQMSRVYFIHQKEVEWIDVYNIKCLRGPLSFGQHESVAKPLNVHIHF